MAREIYKETLGNDQIIRVMMSDRFDGDFSISHSGYPVVEANRQKFFSGKWIGLEQVHKTDLVWINRESTSKSFKADGLITKLSEVALSITTADCAPLALIEENGIFSMLHLGWRSLKNGLLENTVAQMRKKSDASIKAVLGPCVHPCCYEFGEDLLEDFFLKYGKDCKGKSKRGVSSLDIPAALNAALDNLGISLEKSDSSCTSCDDRYWSYRREKIPKRQVMFAWKTSS